jgi:hypothetical protein
MIKKTKLKQINIQISINNVDDLKQSLLAIHEKIMTGNQFSEFRCLSSSISYEMDFVEKSDFTEKLMVSGIEFTNHE